MRELRKTEVNDIINREPLSKFANSIKNPNRIMINNVVCLCANTKAAANHFPFVKEAYK